MKVILGEVWLEYVDLLSVGVKKKTIEMGSYRKSPQWETIKDSTDKRRSLIRYNTLSQSYKDVVKTKMCFGLEPIQWISFRDWKRPKTYHGLEEKFGCYELTAIAKICGVSYQDVCEVIILGVVINHQIINVAIDYSVHRGKLLNKLLKKYRNAGE